MPICAICGEEEKDTLKTVQLIGVSFQVCSKRSCTDQLYFQASDNLPLVTVGIDDTHLIFTTKEMRDSILNDKRLLKEVLLDCLKELMESSGNYAESELPIELEEIGDQLKEKVAIATAPKKDLPLYINCQESNKELLEQRLKGSL